MLTKEDFNNKINDLKSKLTPEQGALISDELVEIMSNYSSTIDTINDNNTSIENYKKEKDELLKINGKLFQKIGFEKEETKKDIITKKEETKKISINDIINEKGEMI